MIFQGGMVWLISFYFLCKYCRLLLCSYHVVVSHSVVSDSLWPHVLQHTRFPCPSLSPGICSNSLPLSRWCHIYISSSVARLSSCPQSFPAPESFPMGGLFTLGGQTTGVSTKASFLLMNIQCWFPVGLTCLIACCSRDSQESSVSPLFERINSLALSLLYGPTLTSVHDYWKKP